MGFDKKTPGAVGFTGELKMERLLFQNDACFVINKLPGESSESPDFSMGKPPIFPVHRLDVPVSGCLLFARDPQAAAFLSKAFAAQDGGGIKKLYWAIVEKTPSACALAPCGELVHWLRFDKRANKSFALAFDSEGKAPNAEKRRGKLQKAVLRYKVIGEGDNYIFLEINLVSGRHHQIRAQLAALSLHIKGDLKYGARRSEKSGGIRLHAFSLAFPDPLNPGKTITVHAPPVAMDSLWEALITSAGAL